MLNPSSETTVTEAPPTGVKKTVAGGKGRGRLANGAYRTRKHLEPAEVEAIADAAYGNRDGARDWLMIVMAYRHGLRVGELTELRWTDVHFQTATLTVRRLKGSKDSTQPLQGDVLRSLRKLRRESSDGAAFVFLSERGAPFATDGFRKMLKRAAAAAGLAHLNVNPHGLRHGTGHYLAERGTDTRTIQDYLGHRDIRRTAQYTEGSSARFQGLWDK
jgi:type 1 fimbriae regulatory protein FimB/type 1 fimbriae regulatory protein FimE